MENRCPCTGQTVTLTLLQDLCTHCPVRAEIPGGLPRISAEIATKKRALTQDLFLVWCKEQLLHFADLAGEYANHVANPHYNSAEAHVSTHFWALAVGDLFRAELTQSLDTPTLSSPRPKQAPAAPATPDAGAVMPTVGDFCCNGFTPADLNRLLADLDVLTETSTPAGPTYRLSGKTGGKGGVRISKTFAALTELSENGLFDLCGSWQTAMKAPPYGLTFGEKILTYTYKNEKSRNGSDTFDAAIRQTRRWLGRWQTAHNSQKHP